MKPAALEATFDFAKEPPERLTTRDRMEELQMVGVHEKRRPLRVEQPVVEPWPDRIERFAGSPPAFVKSTLAEVWAGADDPQPDLIETILGIERRIRAEDHPEPTAPNRRSWWRHS